MIERSVPLPLQAGAHYLKQDLGALDYRQREQVRAPPLADLDTVYTFVLLAATLFIAPLGTYGALIFSLATVGYVAARPRLAGRILADRWVFLLFPACAVLTALWSDAPLETLKHGCEFLLTVIAGLMLSSAPNKRAMVFGLFLAFAAFAFVSLSVGDVVKVGNVGHVTALSGLTTSKNDEAASMATGFLVSVLFLAMGIQSRSLLQCSVAGIAGLVEIFGTVMARSAGALAAACVAVAAFVVFIWLRKAHRQTRLTVIGLACVTALFTGVIFLAFHHDVLEWLSSAFNKDMTLTGRTYLWQRAQEMALDRPVGGRGFAAFWQHGNLDAEGLWQFAHIKTRYGFNFHSTYYDILIGMGWIGLIVFAITLALGAGRAALSYVRVPTLIACFWLAIAVYVIVRMPIETVGTYEFDFATVLLFAMFGSGTPSKRFDARLPRGRRQGGGMPVMPEHALQPRPYRPAE